MAASEPTEDSSTVPECKIISDEAIKEGDAPAPNSAQAMFEFEVTAEREYTEPLGVKVEFPTTTNSLRILLVRSEGILPSWNAEHQGKTAVQVKEDDLIVDVNGVNNDTEKMMQELFAPGFVVLRVQRPVTEAENVAEEAIVEANAAVDCADDTKVEPTVVEEQSPAEQEPVAPVEDNAQEMINKDEIRMLEPYETDDSAKTTCTCGF